MTKESVCAVCAHFQVVRHDENDTRISRTACCSDFNLDLSERLATNARASVLGPMEYSCESNCDLIDREGLETHWVRTRIDEHVRSVDAKF